MACRLTGAASMCAAQAEKLDSLLAHRGIGIDRVLNFSVPDTVLVRETCRPS